MYGNFDGIKNRARLRREVKDLRLDRLEKRKKRQTNSINKNIFAPVSREKFQKAKIIIKEKIRKDKKHQQKLNFILILIVLIVFSFIVWRFLIPFLF
ncbi:MAG: hypothetical protein QM499_11465 [Flavobacteriaceae bacterium]